MRKTIINHCAETKLGIAWAVDLYYEITLNMDYQRVSAASEDIKHTLRSMRKEPDGMYRASHAYIDRSIKGL